MINEKEITNILEQMGNKLTMTDAENARVSQVLQKHMVRNPFSQESRNIPSPYTSTTLWLGRIAVIGAIALVVTGSTLIAAANQALPGDTLYGFKVGVNEEIQSFLKPTPAARLTFESQRTEERLNEAQVLIARGEFNQEAQKTIQKNIEKHSIEITRQAQELATSAPEIYEEVTLLAQNSLAKKAEETKVIAEESLVDPTAHDAVILATLAVTEQATATLTISEEPVLPEITNAVVEATSKDDTVTSTPNTGESLKNNTQYLAYLTDDIQTRVETLIKKETITASATVEVVLKTKVEEQPAISPMRTDTTKEVASGATKTSMISPTATTTSGGTNADTTVSLEKKFSELQALHVKIIELRAMEPLPTERITKNINLFLDTAKEIYEVLETEMPDPVSILPKTNGVIIPKDLPISATALKATSENTLILN